MQPDIAFQRAWVGAGEKNITHVGDEYVYSKIQEY